MGFNTNKLVERALKKKCENRRIDERLKSWNKSAFVDEIQLVWFMLKTLAFM